MTIAANGWFSIGCTLEAHNFQRDLAKYEEMGTIILGISVDSTESHKGFCPLGP